MRHHMRDGAVVSYKSSRNNEIRHYEYVQICATLCCIGLRLLKFQPVAVFGGAIPLRSSDTSLLSSLPASADFTKEAAANVANTHIAAVCRFLSRWIAN